MSYEKGHALAQALLIEHYVTTSQRSGSLSNTGRGRNSNKRALNIDPLENLMKVKTNVRAGGQNRKRGSSTDSSSTETETVSVPVSRCVGI